MEFKNIVFIAKSLDGFIADKEGGLEWLNSIPNPEHHQMGYDVLMNEIDAVVMGKTTFETVCALEGDWPYQKHVFVLSNSIKELNDKFTGKVSLLAGTPTEVVAEIHRQSYFNLYIDGGRTVQNFLQEDLIDELRITTFPILLGGGFPLFGNLPKPKNFKHIKTEVLLEEIVQSQYTRVK